MAERNPYYISFGRIPIQYISRSIVIDSVMEMLLSDQVEEQAFKLTGIRGMGKPKNGWKKICLLSQVRWKKQRHKWLQEVLKF